MPQIINLADKRILVVEDDDMNFVYLNQIFKITKGSIIRAKNGTEAINLAQEQNFDLILMDIQLPDISGIEVTKKIRAINSHIPIVAQTASRGVEEMDDIENAGYNAILRKPFKLDDFSTILNQILISE